VSGAQQYNKQLRDVVRAVSPGVPRAVLDHHIALVQSSVLIIACAGTLVFIAGGLDLSVGAAYALSAVVAARLAQHGNIAVALAAGLPVGVLVGLINGIRAAAREPEPKREEHAQIVTALERLRASAGRPSEWIAADTVFHATLVRSSGNP
jgi:hypothetical protein